MKERQLLETNLKQKIKDLEALVQRLRGESLNASKVMQSRNQELAKEIEKLRAQMSNPPQIEA
jgi:hypothetical protein